MPGGMYNQPNHGLYNSYGKNPLPYDSYANSYGSSYAPHSWDLDTDKLSSKSLWIPLAGVALLGAAALLATNPMYLPLGGMYGKRKRRSLSENTAQDIAYQGYKQS
jgi:hypothetical protein